MKKTKASFAAVLLLLVVSATVSAQKKEKPLGPNAIPAGTTIFIEPNDGFEAYLMAALEKAKAPLLVVIDKEKATLVLSSTLASGKEPGRAEAILLGSSKAIQDATIMVVDPKTSAVRFSSSARKYGKQSTAEALAKDLKKK